MIKLAYALWKFTRSDPSQGSGSQKHASIEAVEEVVITNVNPKLEQLQDCPKNQSEVLSEWIAVEGKQPQLLLSVLACPLIWALLTLLKKYKHVHVDLYWNARTRSMTSHAQLDIKEGTMALKYLRGLQAKAQGADQAGNSNGFIKPIQHPTWLANIVLVKMKNDQISYCIYFHDLNKSCLKDKSCCLVKDKSKWHVIAAWLESRASCKWQPSSPQPRVAS